MIPFERTEVKAIIVAIVHSLVISGDADAVMTTEIEVHTDFSLTVHSDFQVLVHCIVYICFRYEKLLIFRQICVHSIVKDIVVV